MIQHLVECTACGWAGARKIVNCQPCPWCQSRVKLRGRSPNVADCPECRGNGGYHGFGGYGRRALVCRHCYGTGVKDGQGHGMLICDSCDKPSATVTAMGYGLVFCPACVDKDQGEGETDV